MATIRERILAFGPYGGGKSYAWLKLARALKSSGTQFFVIDTDDAIPFMIATSFPDLDPEQGGNVHLFPVYEWPDYMRAQREVRSQAKEGDWIVVDMADMAWKTVQEYFVNEVFKQDIGDYFLQARIDLHAKGDKTAKGKDVKNLQPMKGWIDWPVINKLYDDFMLPLVYRTPAHLYMTAKASTVSREDDEETRDIYGAFGVKPSGQKDLGHQVHTVLLFQQGRDVETWEFSTVKDRRPKHFDHARLIDFPKQYMMAVAGFEFQPKRGA